MRPDWYLAFPEPLQHQDAATTPEDTAAASQRFFAVDRECLLIPTVSNIVAAPLVVPMETFNNIALPLMVPGLMTVLLISVVAVWNNYFLPLLIFNVNTKYPLTVGLGLWSERAQNSGNAQLFPMVVIGGLVTIIPLVGLFLLLQRYWRGGLLLGSIAN